MYAQRYEFRYVVVSGFIRAMNHNVLWTIFQLMRIFDLSTQQIQFCCACYGNMKSGSDWYKFPSDNSDPIVLEIQNTLKLTDDL